MGEGEEYPIFAEILANFRYLPMQSAEEEIATGSPQSCGIQVALTTLINRHPVSELQLCNAQYHKVPHANLEPVMFLPLGSVKQLQPILSVGGQNQSVRLILLG